MVRKSLVALMMGVLCAGSALGDDAAAESANATASKPAATGIVGWFRNKTSGSRATRSATASTASTGKLGKRQAPVKSDDDRSAIGRLIARNQKPATRAATPGQGIERAVVADAERQAITIRQTSGKPQDSAEFVHEQPVPQPLPQPFPPSLAQPREIQQQPLLPNDQIVTGPQYFSATPVGMSNPIPVHPSGNWQTYQAPMPTHLSSNGQYWNVSNSNAAAGPQYLGSAPMSAQTGGMYPQTGASLYPAPIPGIPQQIGGTAIMNQAFHPHEMLYAHQYKAMYGPYYYKVNGGWMVTPFGVWSNEHWHLQGTQVDVKYKSHISPFAHFSPPVWR